MELSTKTGLKAENTLGEIVMHAPTFNRKLGNNNCKNCIQIQHVLVFDYRFMSLMMSSKYCLPTVLETSRVADLI